MKKLRRQARSDQLDELGGIKFHPGQIVLGVLMLSGIVFLGGWSVYASQPHQVEKLSILSEANDAASLAYSQRESFNTAIALEEWMNEGRSYRDLQITRALLGQRLQVRLGNGELTYDQLSDQYKWSLAAIDKIIIQGRDLSPAEKHVLYAANDEALQVFLTETRRLSSDLARLSLNQVNDVVQSRTKAELYQAVITLTTAGIGAILFLWLIRDITRRFRRSRKILQDEQKKLTVVMNTLSLMRGLDSMQNGILNRGVDTWAGGEFMQRLNDEVAALSPDSGLSVEMLEKESKLVKIHVANPENIDEYELEMIQERVQEIATVHASRRRLLAESNYRAAHDHVTGLLNANGLAIEIGKIRPTEKLIASTFFDIDRFHRINDSMGFQYGDSILKKIAEKLSAHTKPGDLLARISSDEFVLITQVTDLDEARHAALDIQSSMEFVARNDSIEVEVTVSAGLLVTEFKEVSAENIMHNGAIAANIAGRQTRAGFAVYNEFEGKELVEALAEEFALKQALRNNEFELFYQPVIELGENKVAGAESLIRWRRPGHGLIYPDDFLPKLRDYNLMDELGRWVLEAAIQMRKNATVFQTQFGIESFKVGINVEASQLLRPEFADQVMFALNESAIDPASLVLEITEHALSEGDIALENLERLKGQGVLIAMDDFGTGYSNLSQIHRLPLSILKLDKSFMPRENMTKQDEQLILDIALIAKSIGVQALAEGVETSEVHDFITSIGITYSQGYLYAPAMPEVEFWNWVRERTQGGSLATV